MVTAKGMEERRYEGERWESTAEAIVERAYAQPTMETMGAVRIAGASWGDWGYVPADDEPEALMVAYGRGRNDVHRKHEKRRVTPAMKAVRAYLREHPDQPIRTVTIVRATGLLSHTVSQAIFALSYWDPCIAEEDDARVYYNTEMSERSDGMLRLLMPDDDDEGELSDGQTGMGV